MLLFIISSANNYFSLIAFQLELIKTISSCLPYISLGVYFVYLIDIACDLTGLFVCQLCMHPSPRH